MSREQEKPASKEKDKDKGKLPARLLPQLATVSTKPQWQEAAPSFHLNIKQEEEIPEPFSVKNEQSYAKSKFPHKERENFRSTLVNVIM
ncbi:Dynein heavy chain 7, axonemal [Myotis brandtii]|uniref:Dynein heavy chain 7, axonemal n=1 Tax=Myotis brandtii TaxID=109478 RepID=S7NWF5_MYOBR|nr:Dynein heavy chain 7, axonemal [Myotis brandtii]